MDSFELNLIAFNNLNELCTLSSDKYITIEDNKIIKIRGKSDSCDNIDDIFKENDVEYGIYFTFMEILMYMKNTDNIYVYKNYTRKHIFKRLSSALDNLYLMYMNDEDNPSKLSPVLNTLDDLLIDEYEYYMNNKCYYTLCENIIDINNTFKKIIGIGYKNHSTIIKYYLPDLEPILHYKLLEDTENTENTEDTEDTEDTEEDDPEQEYEDTEDTEDTEENDPEQEEEYEDAEDSSDDPEPESDSE